MATYNGERYIEAQLRSIFPQLGEQDEIVVVDDASQDFTVERVRSLQHALAVNPAAPQLSLIVHKNNVGVVGTFEEALRCATGDILFLCDHDDLWSSSKVHRVLEVFDVQPATQMVTTGLRLIDEFDQPLSEPNLLKHRRFDAGLFANLLHNQFQGSTMAFRAALLEVTLPLPKGQLFLHDAWIGTRNSIVGGITAHIDEPLLLYRRHNGNHSRRLSRHKQVLLRLQLIKAHLRRLLSGR